jgi:phosphatidate cytidylyltransferase
MSGLATRVLTALVLVPLTLAALFLLPARGWALVSLAVIGAAAAEWASLAAFRGKARFGFVAGTLVLGGWLLFAEAAGFDQGWPDLVVLAVCGAAALFWIGAVPFWLRHRWQFTSPVAMAIVGWLVLVAAWMAIAELQARSPWLVLAAMAIVWIADTAAYFAGRAFGRHKLAPLISPGKTWEGVGGALVAVAVYAVALVPYARDAGYTGRGGGVPIALWIALALVLTALSVCGDLFESLLKRHAGVKDSGKLLPGHGGILDRTDALLAAMPAAAVAILLFLR